MTQCTADFETGVAGNNIATTDTGSATAFDNVGRSAFGVAQYSNAHPAFGTLGGRFGATGAGGGTGWIEWSTALGTVTDHYGRLYLYLTAYDSGSMPIINVTSAGSRAARIDFRSDGLLAGFDNPAAALFPTFATPITLNQLVRLEWHIVHSATVGSAEVKLFNTANAVTPTETQLGTNKNTLANGDTIQIGVPVGNANANYVLSMDNIIAGATSYPGPASSGVLGKNLHARVHIHGG